MLKPKLSKGELKEIGEEMVKALESQRAELVKQIEHLNEKVEEVERKVRWIKREILDV